LAPLAPFIAHGHDTVTLEQAVTLLALAGDLASGAAPGQADRDARLADDPQAQMVARLRQSGYPAGASASPALAELVAREVAADIAAAMGLPAALESTLRDPSHNLKHDVPPLLTTHLSTHLPTHLPTFLPASVSLTLVADAIELKLPWLAGHSRRVALLAQRAAAMCGLPEAQQRLLVRAALLHSLGRLAIPNAVWQRPARLNSAEREAVASAPYWTSRAAGNVAALAPETQLAAQAFARPGDSDTQSELMQRVLAAAVVRVALGSPRPWRAAHTPAASTALLEAQATSGRLDHAAVRAVSAAAADSPVVTTNQLLSAREIEVLRRISLGQHQKEVARALRLSSAAVRIHIDAIFHKLGSATRPAATLKALRLGLI